MGDRFRGKAIIVTGAGSIGPGIGNGKAASILYAREGGRVLLVDRDRAAAEETRRLIADEGGQARPLVCDVTSSDDCRRMAEGCLEAFGSIDVLHNNVGITIPGGPVELAEEDWDRIMRVNVKSVFLACKHVLPHMERQGRGVVVNIASVNAVRSLSAAIAIAYSASKAAILAMTREIAVQYAAKGIRANTVLPGLMDTPMVKAQLISAYGGDVEQMGRRRAQMCPMGRQGDGWDTALAALFLASEEAKYITGTTLTVDGGLSSIAG
ncbi:MAG TPA: SDR family NAD(P)-dependent oxidoreductase [Candidatus Acidoferrum sp.]|nr:SDR family NAD(P)-dependent oxidoreductase [Candidatus Acidoferrum sp.]